ncbi:MAG: hypothetical protein H0T69_05745 [Thermoleophilaceae bacterium]|nr:hypothetical protein [Thermoleophilaceae bacterium]
MRANRVAAVLAGAVLISVVPAAGAAERPLTIPALREWHGAPGAFELRASSRIVVASEGLAFSSGTS